MRTSRSLFFGVIIVLTVFFILPFSLYSKTQRHRNQMVKMRMAEVVDTFLFEQLDSLLTCYEKSDHLLKDKCYYVYVRNVVLDTKSQRIITTEDFDETKPLYVFVRPFKCYYGGLYFVRTNSHSYQIEDLMVGPFIRLKNKFVYKPKYSSGYRIELELGRIMTFVYDVRLHHFRRASIKESKQFGDDHREYGM